MSTKSKPIPVVGPPALSRYYTPQDSRSPRSRKPLDPLFKSFIKPTPTSPRWRSTFRSATPFPTAGKRVLASRLYDEYLLKLRLDDDTLMCNDANLIFLRKAKGDLDECPPLFELTAITGSLKQLFSANWLGLDAATKLYEEALQKFRVVLGNDHPHTLTTIGTVAAMLNAKGDRETAEALMIEALTGRRRALGDAHPHTLLALWCVAAVKASPEMYDEAVRGFTHVLGADHPHTLLCEDQLDQLEAETATEDAAASSGAEGAEQQPELLGLLGAVIAEGQQQERAVESAREHTRADSGVLASTPPRVRHISCANVETLFCTETEGALAAGLHRC